MTQCVDFLQHYQLSWRRRTAFSLALGLNLFNDDTIPVAPNWGSSVSHHNSRFLEELVAFFLSFNSVLKKFLQQQLIVCKSSICHCLVSSTAYVRATFAWKMAYSRVPLRHPHADMLLSCLSSPWLRNSAAYKRELISWESSLFWSGGNSLANDEL